MKASDCKRPSPRETTERQPQPHFIDHRTSISKLHRVTDFLSQFYDDGQAIPNDDVVFAIEDSCGSDSRTIRKHLQLLVRHGYLVPVSQKRSEIVQSRKFVQVRTKSSTMTREYSVDAGFRFYVLGPRAPRRYQQQLNPPAPPARNGEWLGRNNMCVSRSDLSKTNSIATVNGSNGRERKKRKKEIVLHTHISCKNTSKLTGQPSKDSHEQLNRLERAILRISKEGED